MGYTYLVYLVVFGAGFLLVLALAALAKCSECDAINRIINGSKEVVK